MNSHSNIWMHIGELSLYISCVRGFLVSLTHQIDLYDIRFSTSFTVNKAVPRFRLAELTDNHVCIFDSCVFNNDVIVTEKMWR